MKKNMGAADRIIRTIIALVIVVLYLMNVLQGTLGIVLMVIAGILVLTSLFSFCPLYAIFGISTAPKK
jgi:fatty acid desaturase